MFRIIGGMKLLLAIVHGRDKAHVSESLVRGKFKFTIVGTTGGFLREGNSTFMLALENDQVPAVKAIFEECAHRREQTITVAPYDGSVGAFMATPESVRVGGGILFILNIEDSISF